MTTTAPLAADAAEPAAAAALPPLPPEQLRYARWLAMGARGALITLVVLFALYVAGVWPSHVPPERLSELWGLPLKDYLHATASPTGWAWAGMGLKADLLNLWAVALLVGISELCLLSVLPIYLGRRDHLTAAMVIGVLLVLLLAASGVLTVGH